MSTTSGYACAEDRLRDLRGEKRVSVTDGYTIVDAVKQPGSPQVRQTLPASRLCLQHTLRWDILKEEILVCHTPAMINNSEFQAGSPPHQQALLHHLALPPAGGSHHMEQATHNARLEICRQFNLGRCNKGAECYSVHKCWVTGCGGEHSAKACPRTATVAP